MRKKPHPLSTADEVARRKRIGAEAPIVTDAMVDAMLDVRYAGTDWRAIIGLEHFAKTRALAKCELIAALRAQS